MESEIKYAHNKDWKLNGIGIQSQSLSTDRGRRFNHEQGESHSSVNDTESIPLNYIIAYSWSLA